MQIGRAVRAAGGGLGLTNDTIREVPAGPQPGASPVAVVNGFLRAMVDSDSGYGVARSYLAPGTSWDSGVGITTYAEPLTVRRVSASAVSVTARRVGTVGPRGTYRLAPGTVSSRFTVVKRSGQWRIARLPRGVLLSTDDAERSLQPASIYYLNLAQDRVVPDVVLVARQPGIATALMRELLAGPSAGLAPGVRTAAPRGTTLVANVPVSADGVADVDLSAGARQMSSLQLVRLSAQVVWTLRQLSSVTAVRLFGDGSPLTAPDVPALQPIRSWSQFDPAAPARRQGVLIVHHHRIIGLGADVPSALAGRRLVSPRVSADGATVAALRRHGRGQQLLVGSSSGPLRVRMSAARITAPAFTPGGDVLVVTSAGRLLEVPPSGRIRRVQLPASLSGADITDLAVARSGARLAFITGPVGARELDVGTLSDGPGPPALGDVYPVVVSASDASGVAWAGENQIVTTVRQGTHHRGVVEASVDGYQKQVLTGPGLPPAPGQVTAVAGQRVLASNGRGVWEFQGRRWQRVAAGGDPSYAGS